MVLCFGASCAAERGDELDAPELGVDTDAEVEEVEAVDATPFDAVETDISEVWDDAPTETEAEVEDVEVEELAPWQPPTDPFEWPLIELHLDLDALDRALLESNPQAGVEAFVVIADQPPIAARVTLSGDGGFEGKPALSVRFGTDQSEVHHGTDALRLDPMTDDPSQMRGRLMHLLARRFGVAVPRATHAVVAIGELELGLYTVIEPPTSPAFLERATQTPQTNGTTTGSVFASQGPVDLWPWQVVDYLRISGTEDDRVGLVGLAEAMEVFRLARLRGEPIPLADALGERVVLGSFVDVMAFEVALGHWGGYARRAASFALHVAPTPELVGDDEGDRVARVTFLPVGLDLSLADRDPPNPWVGGGKLLGQCRDDPACRAAYGAALARYATPEVARELVTLASQVRLIIGGAVEADSRRGSSLDEVRAAQDRLLWTLEQQPGWIAANLACTDPDDVDADGDGFSLCTNDCDDDRDDVFPGAPEQCNLRDDDCDGVLDDDPACPDCIEAASPRDGVEWLVCYAPRTWNEAAARCVELGGVLASIGSEAEHTAYLRAALGLQWTSWWLGLSDQRVEGIFEWADGEPLAYSRWGSGEPNDSGGREDCAHLVPWNGLWNDLDCGRRLPFVCQRPDR